MWTVIYSMVHFKVALVERASVGDPT